LTSCVVSFPGVADAVHGSDLVLNIGPLLSDSNTGSFTRDIKESTLVILGHDSCEVQGTKYPGVHFLPVLKLLVAELKKDSLKYNLPRPLKSAKIEVISLADPQSPITTVLIFLSHRY
jgi:pyruvate decarboxylase